jgi:hypothetical protein
LSGRVRLVQAQVQDTGLDAGGFDVAFMRNVLAHNGPTVDAILHHIAALLRPGGHLLSAELDVTGLVLAGAAPEEQELEQRWLAMMRKRGNDPGLGRRLAVVISQAGFRVAMTQDRIDQLSLERSPTWTARRALLADGLATEADIGRWEAAITRRLRTTGNLSVQLPVSCVVAARP